jgi:hypothetical protein
MQARIFEPSAAHRMNKNISVAKNLKIKKLPQFCGKIKK